MRRMLGIREVLALRPSLQPCKGSAMSASASRRGFFSALARGAFLASLGPSLAIDLGLLSKTFADELEGPLHFGEMEPLVCAMQETPLPQLQPLLIEKLKQGASIKSLVAAAALANARTFGGEDYVGFHTFMALAPAFRMASLMPAGEEPLPILKVLYRNTRRIQEVGTRSAEKLRDVQPLLLEKGEEATGLYQAIRNRNVNQAEQLFANLVAHDPQLGLDALLPAVQDKPEVHRTVLPFRAWEMIDIVGVDHALTLLRQSLHYCLMQSRGTTDSAVSEQAAVVVKLFDEFNLHDKEPGNQAMDDHRFEELSAAIATASAYDSARAAASCLAEGFAAKDVGEALSHAASLMVLRDGGRLPQFEDVMKPAGCVHGDSVGVHASDAANAWRNLAKVSSGPNRLTCLIIGAWQIAHDRAGSLGLMPDPLPYKPHVDLIHEVQASSLTHLLREAIESNMQAHAVAVVHRYGQLSHPPRALFDMLVRYAVSEDGALHAEKYFQTVWDDFHITRPSARWRHMMSLARVTASEYGRPAAGQAQAIELLAIKS